MQHEFVIDGEDSVLSGGSSILVDGGLPAERFSNSLASWERRETRQRDHRQRLGRREKFPPRGETRATTAPEYNEDVPAYSVFLPTIGVEVTASRGRFSVTQRRSPNRRVWRERKMSRPRTTIGPMLSEPSVEDPDGFDKTYGDRPTPIITASPQKIIRVRPLGIEPSGKRTVRGGKNSKVIGATKDRSSSDDAQSRMASTLSAYFEQQGPRPDDVVWAGDGGNYPGSGMGHGVVPQHRVRTAPHTAPANKRRQRSNDNDNDNDEFTPLQQQSPYWSPKVTVPKYSASRINTADSSPRRNRSQDIGGEGGEGSEIDEEEMDFDERRQYLTTPDMNAVRRDYVAREQLKSMLSASVDHLTGQSLSTSSVASVTSINGSGIKRRKQPRQRPRTVQAYTNMDSGSGGGKRKNVASKRHGTSPGRPRRGKPPVSSASATSLRISTRGSSRGGLRKRPGTAQSTTSDKSVEYIACASCHRQRSRFSDFCNVCVRKMDARRKDNAAERRAIWSREGKSATFLLELSGTTEHDAASAVLSAAASSAALGERNVASRGGVGSRGSSQQQAMDIAITRLTFNEATSTNKLLREARLDAVAAAKKRGAGSLHGWLDALAMSSEANHAIKRVQSVFRGYHFRSRFRRGRWCITRLQSFYWGMKDRVRVNILKHRWAAAAVIQKHFRGVSCRTFWNFDKMRPAALQLQTNFRGYLCRMELRRLKWEKEMKLRIAAAWKIQCAIRQRLARNKANYHRSLRDGATGLQKTFRMYVVRIWFLEKKMAAIVIQNRLIRRRLAQDYVDQLRAERDQRNRELKLIQDGAMTTIQRQARVWLACRFVDRLREKYDDAMEAIELGQERYDETSATGEWPDENLYAEYALHLTFMKNDIGEAARIFRAGIGRYAESSLLSYLYALLLGLRRAEAQNDLSESDRRLKTAVDGDPVRSAARRVEILLRCLIKMDGTNSKILATYALFHRMMRSHATSRKFYLRAIKLDPYNDKVLASFAELEEIEVRKRATIRGENPTAWFTEGDFAFEELALEEVEQTVPYSTLQEDEDAKRLKRMKLQITSHDEDEQKSQSNSRPSSARSVRSRNKKEEKKSVRLQFSCKMLGDNIMIEGVQIWRPPSALLIELGLASPYRPDDFPDPAPMYRMFLDDRDVRIFVRVLDMSNLLHAKNRKRLLKMILDRTVLIPPKLSSESKYQLGVEFRQEPWLSVGIVTPTKIYMTLQVQMVDFVAERLAREDAAETKELMEALSDEDDEEEEGDGQKKKKKKRKKKKPKRKKKKALSKKEELKRFKRQQKGLPAKKKRRKKSVFDVVALPEELERLVEEQTRVIKEIEKANQPDLRKRGTTKGSRPSSRQKNRQQNANANPTRIKTDIETMAEDEGSDLSDSDDDDDDEVGNVAEKKLRRQDMIQEKLSKGRHIIFNAHIPKMKKTWKLRVSGTLITKMFCDKPLLLRQFMRPGWRLGARPLVMRLAQMLDLVHSNDTPRVYEKKYVRGADGKFEEIVVDVTPDHEPSKRLMLVGLRERMEEATRNIAATEIQRVVRGIEGRAYAKNVIPQTNARNIQRCWRGKMGRIKGENRRLAVTRFRGARGLQSITRRALARIHFQEDLTTTMPFSTGRWNVAHGALTIQRDSIEVYDSDPDNLVACFRASLFKHTLSTPVDCKNAAAGYMRVLEGHAGHNASLHFCVGILLLSGFPFGKEMTDDDVVRKMSRRIGKVNAEKKKKLDKEDEEEWENISNHGTDHIRKGYNMDPGGKRFSIVEEAYFERAASIHPLNVDANLTYGVLLFEVRRDATNALVYLRRAKELVDEQKEKFDL
jgi:hypothetical protein